MQPRPYAAIELIHKQPVSWRKERVVSCDGGGGPLGHPRIFINLDKPQINWCTYCGLPFVGRLRGVGRLADNLRRTSTIGNTSSLCRRIHTRLARVETPPKQVNEMDELGIHVQKVYRIEARGNLHPSYALRWLRFCSSLAFLSRSCAAFASLMYMVLSVLGIGGGVLSFGFRLFHMS